jgi:hypothetical protein
MAKSKHVTYFRRVQLSHISYCLLSPFLEHQFTEARVNTEVMLSVYLTENRILHTLELKRMILEWLIFPWVSVCELLYLLKISMTFLHISYLYLFMS